MWCWPITMRMWVWPRGVVLAFPFFPFRNPFRCPGRLWTRLLTRWKSSRQRLWTTFSPTLTRCVFPPPQLPLRVTCDRNRFLGRGCAGGLPRARLPPSLVVSRALACDSPPCCRILTHTPRFVQLAPLSIGLERAGGSLVGVASVGGSGPPGRPDRCPPARLCALPVCRQGTRRELCQGMRHPCSLATECGRHSL